ncbi:aminopeptidase N [Diachasma alloeum]|uniref:aminopeptidase N n=1 Tax=Diachasma alloeum TaxID=454923 RepID=UPI0007382FF4|nr:aminopeptidase N [Diachasma alloeum]
MAHLPSLLVAITFVVCAGAIPLPEDEFSIDIAVPETRSDPKVYRLPEDVVPESYNIRITPDLESDEFTFTGVSEINIIVKKNISKITLHANSLNITMVALRTPQNVTLPAVQLPLNVANDFLIINSKTQLTANSRYVLELEYEGKLNDDMRGFYRSSYVDDYGKKRWLATTQFEPTYARRAFPCWDEPHWKATFDISIKHPDRLRAISNMHKISTQPDTADLSKSITTFASTKKMSTYLIAFVVSDFNFLSNKDGSFKIWARPNAIRHGEFALDVGEKELKALENYTTIPFLSHGFSKMDSIAIPQFEAGAMENWGLVTYRESALLVEENVTTSASKEGVATVITHEFAHQWFGDLVSPKWWQYTWLNEGFATYFQYVITDLILPKWRLKDLQVVKALQSTAFPGDSVSTAVDMNYDVNSPAEIKAKFNTISYQKAGSVIRMINHVVGEKNFKAALQAYLKAKEFNVATSDDLFNEFKKVATSFKGTSTDPLLILNNWAITPGFPLINVTRNYEKGTVNITQERYLYKPDANHTERYYVPLNYAMKKEDFDDTSVTTWLEKDKSIVNFDVKALKDKWIIFNKQHFGYYRVNYDEQNWQLITEFLKTKNYTDIHVLNRGQLVDDALNLARNGKLKWSVAFDLMAFLKQDFDYVPWFSALTGVNYLQRTLANTAPYGSFKAHLLELLEPVVKNITFYESPEDLHLTKLLRVEVLHWACKLGSKPCRDQAALNVTNWLNDSKKNSLEPNLKGVVLCAGIRNTDQATWDKLFAKYLAGEENALLTALGCSSNTNILKGYLTKAMNTSVSTTNRDGIFSTVTFSSDEGVDVALDFILANADQIYQLSGNTTEKLKTYITNIGSKINRKAQLDKLKEAKNPHVKSIFADGISKAQETLEWLLIHESQISEHYKKEEVSPAKPDSAVTVTLSSLLFIMSFVVSQLY